MEKNKKTEEKIIDASGRTLGRVASQIAFSYG
jgi:ribosomal protein L13